MCNATFAAVLCLYAFWGHGETDLAHKGQQVLHFAKLLTGTEEGLRQYRMSVRGMCTDQGTERALCDLPNLTDVAGMAETLERINRKELKLVGSEPNAFLFPVACWVSGPLHIIWNAYESGVSYH